MGAIPVNANQSNQWNNISGQNWKWLNDAYGGKKYTFTPVTTGKYWVYAGYAEERGDASFSLSWDSNKDITVENETFPVKLSLYENGVKGKAERSNIDPNKDTVVVIHGRGNGTEDGNIINLAETVAASQYYPNSQVLYLDWKEAANDPGSPALLTIPYDAAKRIRPVADWATNRLKELGIDPKRTILLGHSLGSYVASEIGRISGGVKNLVALDPASPAGDYDIDGNNPGDDGIVEFSKTATKSIALVVSDSSSPKVGAIAGDNEQATTADYSYLVNFTGYVGEDAARDYHNRVIDVFKDLASKPSLSFPSLLTLDRFDNFGKVQPSLFVFDRAHEGVISADLSNGNSSITGLDYVSNGSNQRTWI
ncbi:hypothetical protein [Microcoleus sp. Pol12B5]|uniref:hypothetical protein n=1 Tax=Microcoleus sp. Pol12B5 TaxID=3055396 RepID=UPI002FD61879